MLSYTFRHGRHGLRTDLLSLGSHLYQLKLLSSLFSFVKKTLRTLKSDVEIETAQLEKKHDQLKSENASLQEGGSTPRGRSRSLIKETSTFRYVRWTQSPKKSFEKRP